MNLRKQKTPLVNPDAGVKGKFVSFTKVKDTNPDVFFFQEKLGQELETEGRK